jgi:hypothetical protein
VKTSGQRNSNLPSMHLWLDWPGRHSGHFPNHDRQSIGQDGASASYQGAEGQDGASTSYQGVEGQDGASASYQGVEGQDVASAPAPHPSSSRPYKGESKTRCSQDGECNIIHMTLLSNECAEAITNGLKRQLSL